MRAQVVIAVVVVGAMGSACGSTTWEPPIKNGAAQCDLVVCLAGAGGKDSGANPVLEDACGGLSGVVRRCDANGRCHALMNDLGEARAALDDLAELVKGQAADACAVRVLGHSWGGSDSLTFASDVLARKAPPMRVDLAIVLDGYVLFGDHLDVPSGVGRTVSFRHSVSPADDCSTGVPGGPFRGLPIRCAPDADCSEFDLSLHGTPVDHCGLVSLVFDEAIALLQGSSARDLGRDDAVDVLRR